MFKSIFIRLLSTYLILTLLITGSLAIILSLGFNQYIFLEKKRILSAAALKVENLMNGYYQGTLQPGEMQIGLDTLGDISDSTVYVLKVDQVTLDNPQNIEMEVELAQDYLLDDLKLILDGQNVYRKKQFSHALDTDVVFFGTPLKVEDEIIGAVLIFSPLKNINTYLAQINGVIAVAALAAVIFSFFFISITAARISRPIREMEISARGLATGERVPDLHIHTGDEIEGLAESFNYMKKQVEATEHMRREFIANVSHELRTPLTSINGFIQGILDGLVPAPQYGKYLHLVQEETQRLIRLTGDILELAKIQGGNIKLEKRTIDIQDLLGRVLVNFDIPVNYQEVNIEVECPDGLMLYADPDRLQQILHNLIGNALRYTPEGGIIKIQVYDQAEWMEFMVSDTGPGINPEDLPYIFNRFYGDNKGVQGHKGTGLGLSIVQKLVEIHGGSIQVKSQLKEGSCFIFQLPKV